MKSLAKSLALFSIPFIIFSNSVFAKPNYVYNYYNIKQPEVSKENLKETKRFLATKTIPENMFKGNLLVGKKYKLGDDSFLIKCDDVLNTRFKIIYLEDSFNSSRDNIKISGFNDINQGFEIIDRGANGHIDNCLGVDFCKSIYNLILNYISKLKRHP